MSPLVEKITNNGLCPEATNSSFDNRSSNSTCSIGSAIFTSDRSTPVTTQRNDLLAVLSMTTSGVKLHLTISPDVISEIISTEYSNYLNQESVVTRVVPLPEKSTQQSINKLRKLSGLTWEQIATLFAVSRRSIHFWASGEPLSSANQEKLNRMLDAIEYIDRGSASSNRSLLMAIADEGKTYLELLAAGKFDRVKDLLGEGNALTKPKLAQLSPTVQISRLPSNPADLVDALQDAIHGEVGKVRAVKSVRSGNK